MIGLRCFKRPLSTSRLLLNKLTPQQKILQTQVEKAQNEDFKSSLLSGEFPYKPKTISQANDKDPINVELLNFKPIRLPAPYKHEVASLRFRGYSEEDIQLTAEFASRAAFYLGIPVSGIIKNKTEKRLYTVIRSPFAQAKSKENFWRTTFCYKLKAYDANPDVVDLWLSYINKYALSTVQYNAKITTRESVDFSDKLDALELKDIQIPQAYAESDDPVMQKVDELLKSDTFKQHFKSKD